MSQEIREIEEAKKSLSRKAGSNPARSTKMIFGFHSNILSHLKLETICILSLNKGYYIKMAKYCQLTNK
jgi:hypothetical protein